jgi:hypothetical protein
VHFSHKMTTMGERRTVFVECDHGTQLLDIPVFIGMVALAASHCSPAIEGVQFPRNGVHLYPLREARCGIVNRALSFHNIII